MRTPSPTHGLERGYTPAPPVARTHTLMHESAINRTVNQNESPQMMPLTYPGSPSTSSVPSSLSSLEHASPIVTPSPAKAALMRTALQRLPTSGSGKSRSRGGDGSRVDCASASTAPPHLEGGGDDVPRIEEMAVMAASLMKPYHTICRKLGNTNKKQSSFPASHVADRLARTEGPDGGGDGATTRATTDSSTSTPFMQTLLFSTPPPEVSKAVAASYPARWFPSITPCFDGGLLYRIEWRRRGHTPLPGESADYAYVAWCFHNRTPCYEMKIDVAFEVPAGCCRRAPPLRGWSETTLSWMEEKEATASASPATVAAGTHAFMKASATCPPLSTIGFITGRAGAFEISVSGVPVSQGPPRTLASPFSDMKLDTGRRTLSSEEGLRLALKERRRFVDPEFPPTNASLQGKGGTPDGATSSPTTTAVGWMRTSHIVARLVGFSCDSLARTLQPLVPTIDPLYIEPGELGDSWLVGAMAAVAEHPGILLRMFRHPKSSENARIERAIGAFRVTLNVQGWWRSVIVDDFLPVTDGNYPRYAHSRRDVRELWMGLLEKVFAKLRGGYANIIAGDPLDALQVLTGWPCARYDIANFKDIAVASSAFASRLQRYDRHGLQIIFHTAPRLSSPTTERNGSRGSSGGVSSGAGAGAWGVSTDPSLSLDDDYPGSGGGRGVDTSDENGLVPGMVYPVLQVLQFSTNPFRAELTLLQVRNIWGDVAAWKGRWRCGSPRWAQWPKVAEACGMPIHPSHELKTEEGGEGGGEAQGGAAAESSGSSSAECTCQRQKYMWLEWNEVCRYFSGCGVIFRLALHHDYRVQGVFEGVRPSVCLRVTVANRSFVGLTLSMQDTGVTAPQMDDGGAASGHPPIMVSLAREQANVVYILRNSQLDPDNPTSLFTFMQASEASLLSLLTPEDSPYLVIPRMLATAAGTSSADGAAPPPSPPVVNRPYVLGFFQKDPVGVKRGSRVEFVQLPATSAAFQNSTCFSLGNQVKSVRAKFQVKSPQAGFPSTYVHTELSEEAGTPADDDFDTASACV